MVQVVKYRPIIATFNYPHNWIKLRCLVFLLHYCSTTLPALPGPALAMLSGLKYISLMVLLGRWHRWKYVQRYGDRRSYRYRLAVRGSDFIMYCAPALAVRQVEGELIEHLGGLKATAEDEYLFNLADTLQGIVRAGVRLPGESFARELDKRRGLDNVITL